MTAGMYHLKEYATGTIAAQPFVISCAGNYFSSATVCHFPRGELFFPRGRLSFPALEIIFPARPFVISRAEIFFSCAAVGPKVYRKYINIH
jgi:hypothetical protein